MPTFNNCIIGTAINAEFLEDLPEQIRFSLYSRASKATCKYRSFYSSRVVGWEIPHQSSEVSCVSVFGIQIPRIFGPQKGRKESSNNHLPGKLPGSWLLEDERLVSTLLRTELLTRVATSAGVYRTWTRVLQHLGKVGMWSLEDSTLSGPQMWTSSRSITQTYTRTGSILPSGVGNETYYL